MNVVTLIGNLSSDVELRELDGGKRVGTFRLAVNRPTEGAEADFFRVTVWERQAELCAQYLAKGRKVGIEGRLRTNRWEDGDGNKRSSVEIVASRVEFLSPPSDAKETPFDAAAATA
jgi:single-strand DNA-binding protein